MTPPLFGVCTTCAVPHYEDCPVCFGFGVWVRTGSPMCAAVPITASIAADIRAGGTMAAEEGTSWAKCPMCGCGPAGYSGEKAKR